MREEPKYSVHQVYFGRLLREYEPISTRKPERELVLFLSKGTTEGRWYQWFWKTLFKTYEKGGKRKWVTLKKYTDDFVLYA